MKYLIITNPISGKKKSINILNKQVIPHLKKQQINFESFITEYPSHARERINICNLDDIDNIIVLGGDGTMHEVINGMLNRNDNINIPIGLIPTGSGNSIVHDRGDSDVETNLDKILRRNISKIDLLKIHTPKQIFYSINLMGWGMVNDIAILAEKMRWLGFQRYNIASLIEIMKSKERQSKLVINNENISNDYSFILCCNTIHTGKGMKIAPKAKVDDGLMDVITVKKTTRTKLFRLFPKIFSGKHIADPIVNYHQASTLSIKPKIDTGLIIDGEIMGNTPCTINILPEKIDIFN